MMKKILFVLLLVSILIFVLVLSNKKYTKIKNQKINITESRHDQTKVADPINTVSRIKKLTRMIDLANVPIKFNGMVVDENDLPVVGVKVDWSIVLAGYFNSPPSIKKSSKTDEKGFFMVTGERGESFGIDKLSKDGYHQARNGYTAKQQEPGNQDAINIVKFLILKDEVADADISEDFFVAVNWNKGPMIIPTGINRLDLSISVNRDSNKPFTRRNWDIRVSMNRAKMIDVGETTFCLAPLDGYQDFLYYSKKSTDPYPNFGETKYLVFKTDDHIYGQINLDFEAGLESQEKCLRFKVLVNKAGFRNLNTEQ